MTYAILQHGGHQYRVAPGDRLLVDRLGSDVGSVVELKNVLFVSDGKKEGAPGSLDAKGFRVAATVVSHRSGPKLRVFKYKPKKRYRRTVGHRSDLTELRVEAVLAAGDPLPKSSVKEGGVKTAKSDSAKADAGKKDTDKAGTKAAGPESGQE